MEESLEDAKDELKRVDHLVFVSLKYTRTVDVIRNTVERMISAFEAGVEAVLKYAREKKKIKEIPAMPGLKCELLQKVFSGNKELADYLDFYLLLRKIIRSRYAKREEYRRHVTMISTLDDGEVKEIDIDTLREYYEKGKSFLKFIENMILGEND